MVQAVVNARAAGYFCLYLIVENPDNADSVLDIRSDFIIEIRLLVEKGPI
jgi:hypothetical protein